MDERLRVVARLLEGEKMAPLCAEFGISRKTATRSSTASPQGRFASPVATSPIGYDRPALNDRDRRVPPMNREIRSYDYVNHPYAAVRDALVKDPAGVLRAATNAAVSRASAVAAALHVNIGPLDIGAGIAITVGQISEQTYDAPISRVTRIPVEWSAAQRAALFPIMNAELSVYPLTSTETQLDFLGRYEPPLGIVGGALDAMVGHRIAEASVHRLVADVANYLREHLR